MTVYFNKSILVLLCFFFSFSSCKDIAKIASKEVAETATRKSVKTITEEVGEKSLRDLTPDMIRRIRWNEVLIALERENPIMATGLKTFSKQFRKGVAASIQSDPRIYNAIISSPTLWNSFESFAGESKLFKKNSSFFAWFARSEYAAQEFGEPNRLSRYILFDEGGSINLIDRGTSQRVARLNDGLVQVDAPFESNTYLYFSQYSIMRDELLPNSVYRIRGENGLEYLFNVDELGRVSSVKVKNITSNELSQNVIYLDRQLYPYMSNGDVLIEDVSHLSKGSDINARITFHFSDDGLSPSYVKFEGDIAGQPYTKTVNTDENLIVRKLITNSNNLVERLEGQDAMDYLSSVNPKVRDLLQQITDYPGTGVDNFIVETTGEGRLLVSHKEWPGTVMEIDGDRVRLKAGSVANSDNQALNQFLNTRMPNMTYEIDDYMELTTDELSRVSEARATYSKNSIIERAGQRDSHTQKRIVESQDGIDGDEGGHILQRALGGGNELGNQVPMAYDVNHNVFGVVERQERDYVEAGFTVSSYRKCIYEGNSKRPSFFIIDDSIDGVPMKVTINGKEYTCPIRVSNTSPAIIEQL